MNSKSKIDILQKDLDEWKKNLKRANVHLSCFELSGLAIVPTQETDALSYVGTTMFADLIRRSYNSMDSESQVEIGEMSCP